MKMGTLAQKSIKLFIVVLIFLTSCTPKETITLNQLNWLLGSREMVSGNQLILETWEQENDTLFIGKSYNITQYDTVLTETIQVIQKENIIYYIPLVFDQNGGEPVLFELKSEHPEQLIFENKEHDFPNRICYYKDGGNINVWIEGGDKKIDFYFIKTK
ncbi:hypothetical protein FRY74_10730 [Vicingus serpentipes]|uniref:DUF6265 domain-containing protein n=1 Tax=Vicingus serpentipes TaxID=1926625 RepID=A0A5C6RQJ0_9FLAO|nr:DUF6265 family protein [Vicingus serpentipes]TXB64259.1 hypothetical protein FRY74_10730 [Vicingus serpentipes]